MAAAARTQLRFGQGFADRDIRVLELPEDLLADVGAAPFVIRGEEGDHAVLCTKSKTFELRLVETSNTCLLVQPGSSEGMEVRGQFKHHYEVVHTAPRTTRLRTLLNKTALTAKNEEDFEDSAHAQQAPPAVGYSVQQLLGTVQCSEAELQEALKALHALIVRDRVRVLDSAYQCEVLDMIVTLGIEKGWDTSSFPVVACARELLDMFPHHVTRAVLFAHVVAKDIPSALVSDVDAWEQMDARVALDAAKVCETKALTLFHATQTWPWDTFHSSWESNCDPFVPKWEMLRGLAIEESVQGQRHVVFLPRDNLPNDPASLFSILFTRKEQWKRSDILPYISQVAGPKASAEALLLKFARALPGGGGEDKMYCARATQNEMRKRKWRP